MAKHRTLGVLALVALLAAALLWMVDGTRAAPPDTAPGPADAAAAARARKAGAGEQQAQEADAEGNARVALEPGPGRTEDLGPAIVGRIVDDAGAPVAEAAVSCGAAFSPSIDDLFDPSGREERIRKVRRQRVEVATDSDGWFRVHPRATSERVTVRVLARGHTVLTQGTRRPMESDVDLGTLTLKRGAVVSGRVVDHTGVAVAGAKVDRRSRGQGMSYFSGGELFAPMRDGDEAVTDDDGEFELAHVRPGEFALRARHPDHPTSRLESLSVSPGEALTNLLVVAEPGATIRGRVLGAPAGQKDLRVFAARRRDNQGQSSPGLVLWGIADGGAVLGGPSFGERSSDVAADGSFALRGLTVDRIYDVWVGQSQRGSFGGSQCSERVEVAAGTQGLELLYENGVTVTFHVVDDRTGESVETLWVQDRLQGGGGFNDVMWYGPGSGPSEQFPDGRVTIANLRPKPKQTLTLTLEAIGYQKLERKDIRLPAVGSLDLGTLRLEAGPVVVVEVTRATDDSPIEGARVSLREHRDHSGQQFAARGRGAARSARTDAEGRCRINGPPGKQVVVAVNSEEHAAFTSAPLNLPARGESVIHARLVRGGAVEVTVLDADGAPVHKQSVERRDPEGRRHTSSTDATGKVVFDRLVPGEHRFRIERNGGNHVLPMLSPAQQPKAPAGPDWESVDVVNGGRATLALVKGRSASLTGIVRENGAPLPRARVVFLEGAGTASSSSRSDAQGRYELEELTAGEHRLRIGHKDRAMPTIVPISLRIGDNVFDVDLDTTVLRGTVRGPKGEPVADATVRAAKATGPIETPANSFGALLAMPGRGRGATVKSGADGVFELRGVQGGTPIVVRATAQGHAPATSAEVVVPVGGSRDGVDVLLGPAGRIHVATAVEAQYAMVSATLQGADASGVAPVHRQLEKGSATLEGLRPGRWKVSLAVFRGQRFEPHVVDVTAGQTTEVVF